MTELQKWINEKAETWKLTAIAKLFKITTKTLKEIRDTGEIHGITTLLVIHIKTGIPVGELLKKQIENLTPNDVCGVAGSKK